MSAALDCFSYRRDRMLAADSHGDPDAVAPRRIRMATLVLESRAGTRERRGGRRAHLAAREGKRRGRLDRRGERDRRHVLLFEPSSAPGRSFDLRSSALRAQIESLGQQRFVMVVDEGLYNRRTFSYDTLAEVPSSLEFLGWADAAPTREPHYGALVDAVGRGNHSRRQAPGRALQR
jgi:hypothetical protein